ncbi:hypothetical protein, partial [Escherichia coli]|uniref:hypothetical protein n=1 Tax=Escherichia coli TaxID=562 RepID=UPI001954A607
RSASSIALAMGSGRKSFILAGMVGFTILSFIYANTRQFEYVVLFRFVQGITVGVAVLLE